VQPAGVCGKDWFITHPIGQRCTDDQPTIKGRTSANFGYSKPLFACVHRTFGDQFIAPARGNFFWTRLVEFECSQPACVGKDWSCFLRHLPDRESLTRKESDVIKAFEKMANDIADIKEKHKRQAVRP
jgi:hypothetical protein